MGAGNEIMLVYIDFRTSSYRFYALRLEQAGAQRFLVYGRSGKLGTKGTTHVLYDGESFGRAKHVLANKRAELERQGYLPAEACEKALNALRTASHGGSQDQPHTEASDEDRVLRQIERLTQDDPPQKLRDLLDYIHHPARKVREAAIDKIVELRMALAAERLVELLFDDVASIRMKALEALEKLRNPVVAPRILAAAETISDERLQERAPGIARRLSALKAPTPPRKQSEFACDLCGRDLGEHLYRKISSWARGDSGWDLHPALVTFHRVICYDCQLALGIFKRKFSLNQNGRIRVHQLQA